ncbi:MAG: DUF11 domain-containing protein [Caldilineaceae bacterium]|nr:DUF11 domain-containing protein [Caldilineaceae bacterium]
MSILTVLTLIRPVFYRLLDKNRSRLPWFALLFLCAIGFSAVEWSQPSFAQTATIPDAGRIRIFKVTEPRGDTTEFSFQLTSQDRNRSFSLADGGKRAFANLAPGDGYAVSEMVPTGWTLKSATCDNGSPVTNIQVGANEVVDCTFVNVKLGEIEVKVTTLPSDDQSTSFTLNAGGGLVPATFTLKNEQQRTLANVAPGHSYSLAQSLPAGWMLGSASCSDGSPVTNIDVQPGERVACTFVNKQLGKLIVRKVTVPNPDRTDSTFAFATENTLTPNTFALKNTESQTFANLEPRTGYRIRELAIPDWQLTKSSCDNNSAVTNIRVDPGQTVICTFTNSGTVIDLSLVKDDGGVTAEPGDTIVYTLRYRNVGTQTAAGVVLTEQVPTNTTFVASPAIAALWDCADNAAAGTLCHHTIGSLAGNTQGQVAFHVKVNSSLPTAVTEIANTAKLGYTGNASAAQSSSTTPVKAKSVLTLNKGDAAAKVKPGETILYTLDYANEGVQDISTVRITETVPAHTTYVALDQGWSCPDGAPAGTQCVRQIGTVGAGKGGTVPFQVRVAPTLPPAVFVIDNRASIGSPSHPNADTGTEQTELQAAPDLAVHIDDKGVTVAPGGQIHLNINYANVGVQAATGVQITVPIPTLATFVREQSTEGWNCTASVCTFVVGTLASGASGTLEWTLQLKRPIPVDSSTLRAPVTIADDGNNGADPVAANNLATEETLIVDPGKLVATKRANLVIDQNTDGQVAPGDTLEYVVTVQNQRGSVVRNVVFTDTLPAMLDLLPGLTATQGAIVAGTQSTDRHVQVDIGTIAADSAVTIRFRTTVHLPVPNGVTAVVNQGLVTSRDSAALVTDDPTTPATHDATVTPIVSMAAVEMTLADFLLIDANNDALVSVGDTLIYRLVVRNRGDGGTPALQIQVSLADNVVLLENGVTTTEGIVRAGTDPEDRAVRVDIGELPGRAEVRLSFQVQIIPFAGATTIQHQAVATAQEPLGQADVYSDDPDTVTNRDATVTTLNQAIVTLHPLYLPLVHNETQ